MTTWSLELRERREIVAAPLPALDLTLVQARQPSPELSRFLYTATGGNWYWTDRLPWTHQQWLDWLTRPGVETWVAQLEGTPAGYFELDGSNTGEVELAYFGLLPACIGRGIGGWLLTRALEQAWKHGPVRVWVHTCSLDGPNALANYKSRGMRVFKVATHRQQLEPAPPGPWPGAEAPGPRAVLPGPGEA